MCAIQSAEELLTGTNDGRADVEALRTTARRAKRGMLDEKAFMMLNAVSVGLMVDYCENNFVLMEWNGFRWIQRLGSHFGIPTQSEGSHFDYRDTHQPQTVT